MLKDYIYFLFRKLPIKRNRILFINYYGKSYGCNPKYISEYLVDKYGDKVEICWAFTDVKKNKSLPFRKVAYASLNYFYVLATSKIICTNYRMTSDFKKRDGQIYFQTWHSSLRLKMIEADTIETLPKHYVEMAKQDSAQTDYVVAGCEKSAYTFANSFWFDGEILRVGTPRNDLLINNSSERRSLILAKLGVNKSERVVLYAPTFREDKQLHYYDIDFDDVRSILSQRFGGEWCVVKRLHPHLSGINAGIGGNIIDATNYDDIQDLLLAADILITDYSSLMFDFALTHRPVFLYAKDLKSYCEKERKLYFNITDLPFPLAENNAALENCIMTFSFEKYTQALSRFNNMVGSYEHGNASEQIGDIMFKLMNP